jgi:hypothetical protein
MLITPKKNHVGSGQNNKAALYIRQKSLAEYPKADSLSGQTIVSW